MPSRILILAAACAAVLSGSLCDRAAAQARRPNLLFILTDQQRADTLGAYGNRKIKTPNLDALAQRSFLFQSFYVSHPQCTPSRATMLTGLYPQGHGSLENNIPLDPRVPILPQMIQNGDYVSAFFGKWHLGDEIFRQRGFDEFESTEDGYRVGYTPGRDLSQRSGYGRFLIERGIQPDTESGHSRDLANRLPKELSKPVYLARKGIEFLNRYRNRPFILYLSFLEPHAFADHSTGPPFKNVNDDLYDPSTMEIPATFFEPMDPTVSFLKREARVSLLRGEFPIAYPQTVDELRQAKARYWGLVTLVDEMIGRVLGRLRELGLEEDTIVVFTSDHGEMMGDHRLMSKEQSYEEAIKVPLLLSVPGQKDRLRPVVAPASQVDLVPTLLELMNQPQPPRLQGQSWGQYLRRGVPPPARDVFVVGNFAGFAARWNEQHLASFRTVITPNAWKLSISDTGEGELYRLDKDPKERVNLYHRTESRPRVKELSEKIRQWQDATGDRVAIPALDADWPRTRPASR